MEKKLGQEPAFPTIVSFENGKMQESYQVGNCEAHFNGVSKRFYAACAAMQGILAGDSNTLTCTTKDDVLSAHKTYSYNYSKIAKNAFKLADELLKQESNG